MEVFLRALLPRVLPNDRTFEVHPFQGKSDMLGKLQGRLTGYARWLPRDWRIFIVVDQDSEDCKSLKCVLETASAKAGLTTRFSAGSAEWQVVNRIAVEELEAWYFGDWRAVCEAFPRASSKVPNKASYRDPDAIRGGTWEAFERVLKNSGYFKNGLLKLEAARSVGYSVQPRAVYVTELHKFPCSNLRGHGIGVHGQIFHSEGAMPVNPGGRSRAVPPPRFPYPAWC